MRKTEKEGSRKQLYCLIKLISTREKTAQKENLLSLVIDMIFLCTLNVSVLPVG